MSFRLFSFLASLAVFIQLLHEVSSFASCPSNSHHVATLSRTVLKESESAASGTSASEKAAELRLRAEEAKRKAEELKKVAEAKAAAAVMAMKKANEKSGSVVAEATSKDMEPLVTSLTDTSQVLNKASSRVIIGDSAIIPINKETIEFTAGVLGATAALALGGGPLLAVVAAAAANYASKKDGLGEINELMQAISKASLETFNWLAKLEAKYTLIGKMQETLDDALKSLKNSDNESAETITTLEKTVSQTSKNLQDLAKDTDLLEGTKQVLGAVGEIIETAVDKAATANREYKLTERATGAVKKAIDKATSSE